MHRAQRMRHFPQKALPLSAQTGSTFVQNRLHSQKKAIFAPDNPLTLPVMNDYTLIGYPRCSTCRKAQEFLKKHGIDLPMRDIKEARPTAEELEKWIGMSQKPIEKWFNTSGMRYRELNLKEKVKSAPREELLQLLASDGMLVKRPILIAGDRVLIGFKEAEWEALL